MDPRPIIGITMGDPAGIGPELRLLALCEPSVLIECVPVLFGDAGVVASLTSSSSSFSSSSSKTRKKSRTRTKDEDVMQVVSVVEREATLRVLPDAAFTPARRMKYDGLICLYHDQGHIPFKMFAIDTGVNITLGLPIIRTSVDHGTAFDIAWKGVTDPQSLFAAIRVEVEMTRGRKTAGAPS